MKFALYAVALSLLASCGTALAGRPLATDDASVTPSGSCQVESWLERSSDERALVLAPACGLAESVELGADYTLLRPRDALRATAGVALKWAPQAWRIRSESGEVAFGLKVGIEGERVARGGWHHGTSSALLLASFLPSEKVAFHANVGTVRLRQEASTASLINLALAWTPSERLLIFGEIQANDRRRKLGGNVKAAGLRFWVVKDRFGIDLTAGRETGSGATTWTGGFGWYGLLL